MIQSFLRQMDRNKRLYAFQQVENELISSDSIIFLYRLQQFAIYKEGLENISLNALGWVDYTKVWYNRTKKR